MLRRYAQATVASLGGFLRRVAERNRTLLPVVFAETAPLDLRYVGRTLLHAVAVGLVCA